MKALRVKVQDGRLVGDAPASLPEGTVLDVCIADSGDDMSPDEHAALSAFLDESWREFQAGNVVPAEDVLARLRTRRRPSR
jgi:hypothetical protein